MSAGRSREPLSRERVLAAAVQLADTEGLPALTMRGLAARLGVEAMSLYHHLPGKEGLLDGLIDAVVGEIEAATGRLPGATDWRAALKQRFLAARQVMLRHPWAPGLFGSRHGIPEGVLRYYEGVLGTLIEAGFSYQLAHRALHAFGSMPLGFIQELFNSGGDTAPTTDADLAGMAQAFPHMAAMVAAELHDAADPLLGWCDSQTEFEFTLDLLLDGLDRLHAGDRHPQRVRPRASGS